VRPDDPYEFVGLLESVDMLASRRNQAIADLAGRLRGNARLIQAVSDARVALAGAGATLWRERLEPLRELPGGPGFLDAFDGLAAGFMDVMYGTERLLDRPDLLLHTLVELAEVVPRDAGSAARWNSTGCARPAGFGRSRDAPPTWCPLSPGRRAVEQLRDGELVTVDGHLGIVTVGPPEFALELA
jgi:hypothetical protein